MNKPGSVFRIAPAVAQFISQADAAYPDANFSVYTKPESEGGENAAAHGKTQLAGVARELRPEILETGVQVHRIGYDAIAVWVHPNNPVRDLSLAQLAGIFSGKITDWSEVDGADGPIRVYLVAPHFLDTYDYEALEKLAADLEEDPEVAFVQFLDAEGRPLTAAPGTPQEGADLSTVEAELSGEVEAGRVRMGLDFQRLREERALAGKAKSAATQTAELLDSTVREIDASAAEVHQVGDRFREVREAIEDPGRKTAAISSANREQARGIDQITAAATQLDAMTQNVSASAQMSAAAAEDLANLVRGMEAVVGDLISVRDGGGETIGARRPTPIPGPERLTECRLVLPET